MHPRLLAPALLLAAAPLACARPLSCDGAGAGDGRCTVPPAPASAPSPSATERPRVLVSTEEARVVFPRETPRFWGWVEGYAERDYLWGMVVDGIAGPRSVTLRVGRFWISRGTGSLAELVAAGEAGYCRPGMTLDCDRRGTMAWVEDGRVLLVLRDTARIRELFGLRPEQVDVSSFSPGEVGPAPERVRVEYVEPRVPEPDSAFRARATEARRRLLERRYHYRRQLAGGLYGPGTLWLAVGDSVGLSVLEDRCSFDVCSQQLRVLSDSGWSVGDRRVAGVRPVAPLPRGETLSAWLLARAPGRTTVRVAGLHGPSTDSLPSGGDTPRVLEREVVVTRPGSRLVVTPRPATVRRGDTVVFHAHVRDPRGQLLRDVPVRWRVLRDGRSRGAQGTGPQRVPLSVPGSWKVVAELGPLADSVTVQVPLRR